MILPLLNTVLLALGLWILNDLKDRVVRLENHFFGGRKIKIEEAPENEPV
jgi:hypothetical protein